MPRRRRGPSAILLTVDWRVTRLGWLVAALLLAVPFAYGMFFVSDANSCGGLDSGPNRGAEEKFCGFGPTNPTNGPVDYSDYSGVFVFVNLVPASIVVVGGLLATLVSHDGSSPRASSSACSPRSLSSCLSLSRSPRLGRQFASDRLGARRAVSSVGRAPARQAGGHWFEPSTAHLWKAPLWRGLHLIVTACAFRAAARVPRPGLVASFLSAVGRQPTLLRPAC
jgi:hypothetical protein